jgi:hypothetical protein
MKMQGKKVKVSRDEHSARRGSEPGFCNFFVTTDLIRAKSLGDTNSQNLLKEFQ